MSLPLTFHVVVPDDPNESPYVVCPHCGNKNTIVEVDRAIRWNTLEFDRGAPMRPIAHMGDEGDWEYHHWYCEACDHKDLRAPDGFYIEEWV